MYLGAHLMVDHNDQISEGKILVKIPRKSAKSGKKLRNMRDNEISKIFLDLKGVGPWTLGIIKMFYIGNNDVFLDGDLGIKKSKLNFFESEEYQAEEYSPYRTFLCLYLWQSLNS